MIDRRAALAGVAMMFGSQVFAPIARAAGLTGPATLPTIDTGPPSSAVFSPAQRATMAALSDRIIPTTDTPGAIAAGVPDYIEKLLADWARPGERVPILAGIDAIEARSQQEFKVSAARATTDQQDALITAAMNGALGDGAGFFLIFRQLVIAGYYTSEIGMTQEREYLPVPGEYHGNYPYSQIKKVFTA